LVRHGHLPEREIMTGIGPVAVRCPRVRDRGGEGSERIRFSSTILPPYARRSKSLSKFAQCGFECDGHRCDVFWPKRVIAVEKWSNRHGEAPGQQ
jgi:hypothetical protein